MVCFSESSSAHLLWLLRERGFPGWGLLFSRQWVYDFGGGPIWYARNDQYSALSVEQQDWAVRFEADTSDWLHEREWRIRVQPEYSGLQLLPGAIGGLIVEDRNWEPWRQVEVPTGYLLDENGTPGLTGVADEVRWELQLPKLWESTPRILWDRSAGQLVELN